jgi:pSer/pThr/pTyr-binding forkhead associated (FHA) protein
MPETPSAQQAIVFTGGPMAGRRVEIEDSIVIGRVEGTLAIDDDEISRRHAILRVERDRLTIEDLSSTNGTRVNGDRIAGVVELGDGDTVQVGRTTFQVAADRSAPATVVASRTVRGRSAAEAPAAVAEPVRPPRSAFAASAGRRRRSIASRNVGFEILTFVALFGTAVALIAYFALR